MLGAEIRVYMFEDTRVARPKGGQETNFRILHLLYNSRYPDRDINFRLLKSDRVVEDNLATSGTLQRLSIFFDKEQCEVMLDTLEAILHLGNIVEGE